MQILVGAYLWRDSAKMGRENHQPHQPATPLRAALLLACLVFAESAGSLGSREQQGLDLRVCIQLALH